MDGVSTHLNLGKHPAPRCGFAQALALGTPRGTESLCRSSEGYQVRITGGRVSEANFFKGGGYGVK